jgi:hypothetical protein
MKRNMKSFFRFFNFKVSSTFLAAILVSTILLLPASAAPNSAPPKGNVDANFSSVNIGTSDTPALRIDEKGTISSPTDSDIFINHVRGVHIKVDNDTSNNALSVRNEKGDGAIWAWSKFRAIIGVSEKTAVAGYGTITGIRGESISVTGVHGISVGGVGIKGDSVDGTGVKASSKTGNGIESSGVIGGIFRNKDLNTDRFVYLSTLEHAILAKGDVLIDGKLTADAIGTYKKRSITLPIHRKTETVINSPCLGKEKALSCSYTTTVKPSEFQLGYVDLQGSGPNSCTLHAYSTEFTTKSITLNTLCFDSSRPQI